MKQYVVIALSIAASALSVPSAPSARAAFDLQDLDHANAGVLPSGTPISGLSIDPPHAEVSSRLVGKTYHPVAEIKGRCSAPGIHLLCDDGDTLRKLDINKRFHFTLQAVLTGKTTRLRCWAVDAANNTSVQEIGVLFPAYDEFYKRANPEKGR